MIQVPHQCKRLLLVFAAMLLLATVFLAQAHAVAAKEPVASSENSAEHAGGEDSSADETAQFKRSPSVRLLSRVTGLSLDGAYWLAVGLNFAIVVGVIVWVSKKNLPQAFRNRTASIQKSLEEARKASEDANRRLREIESRLTHLDEEIKQMRELLDKEARSEEERALAAASEQAERISDSAKQEIAAAAKAARRELTAYVADLAVSLASKQIRVDVATDEVLLRQFTKQLPADGSRGNEA